MNLWVFSIVKLTISDGWLWSRNRGWNAREDQTRRIHANIPNWRGRNRIYRGESHNFQSPWSTTPQAHKRPHLHHLVGISDDITHSTTAHTPQSKAKGNKPLYLVCFHSSEQENFSRSEGCLLVNNTYLLVPNNSEEPF